MAALIQHRRGTAVQWAAANPVLNAGEMGVELDTGVVKVGDGIQTWTALAPASSSVFVTKMFLDENLVEKVVNGFTGPDIQDAIDSLGGKRGRVRLPGFLGTSYSNYTSSVSVDVKRAVLVGDGPPGGGMGGGTLVSFTGTAGFYSSIEDNYGYALSGMRVEGSNGGTVADTAQVLVDFAGQNYPRLTDVTIANGGTGMRLAQGTTVACNYGEFRNVNINKCFRTVVSDVANGLGCNTHKFYGGRHWASGPAVIAAGLSNWVFFGTAFEAFTSYAIDSTGTNISLFGCRGESPETGAISVKIRAGAGAHWRFGNHWSSGKDFEDDNIPSIVYGMDAIGGTENTGPQSTDTAKNYISNGLFLQDTNADGLADEWLASFGSAGTHVPSLIASASEGNWQRVVNTSTSDLRLTQTFTVVPNQLTTLRFRYRVDTGPVVLRVGTGSTTDSTYISRTLTADGVEKEERYTFKPTTSTVNVTFYMAGAAARDFRISGVMCVPGVTSPPTFLPKSLNEYGGKSYSPLDAPVRRTLGPWLRDDVVNTVVDSPMTVGTSTRSSRTAIRSGSVTGVVARLTGTRLNGSITVEITINDIKTGLIATINSANPVFSAVTQASGLDNYVAGDRIGVLMSSASWTENTADLSVEVEIVE